MKNLIVATIVLSLLFACDNPVSKKIKETKEQVTNASKAVEEINNIQEGFEELQVMEPLTNEELKAWLPDEINGMKRISYKAGQMGMVQIASLEAVYENEDKSKKFKVEVIDGAGEMGAAATAGMRMLFAMDFEEEDENKIRRSVKRNGSKAIEEYQKNHNHSSIELMKGNRFYIKSTGTNMDLDETWKAIEELDSQDLG